MNAAIAVACSAATRVAARAVTRSINSDLCRSALDTMAVPPGKDFRPRLAHPDDNTRCVGGRHGGRQLAQTILLIPRESGGLEKSMCAGPGPPLSRGNQDEKNFRGVSAGGRPGSAASRSCHVRDG